MITAGDEVMEVLSLCIFESVFEELLESGRICSAHAACFLASCEKNTVM